MSRKRRPPKAAPKKKWLRANQYIRVPRVMVIDEDGTQLGEMETYRALQRAEEHGLDLVEVSPVAQPPVCRIMDFGAYQYQQEKKERKQKAKQKKVEVKGIRLSLKIGPHDLDLRKNQAVKFLEKGNKVKIDLTLRGRERAYSDRARTIMETFIAGIAENASIAIEQPFTKLGGHLSMLVGKK